MMQKLLNFFDSLWKHKKIIFFVLLALVVIGVLLPNNQPAMAACDFGLQSITDTICPYFSFLSFTPWNSYIYYPLIWISDFLNEICYFIALGCGRLFVYVLTSITSNGAAITRNGVFTAAWYMVKNWAIMLIDVSLIAAALMIILRLWADKAKQLLPQIIIVALLVNFSNVLVGLIYDASNFIMRALIGNTAGGEVSGLILKVNDAWNAIIWPFDVRAVQGFQNIMLYFSLNVLFDVMYIILAISLLFFTLILVQRYVIIAILFIISPLAFALKIVPLDKGQSLFSSWWEHFLKYSFVGLGAAFFLRLSTEVVGIYRWDHLADGDTAALLPLILHFGIVLIFLVFGLHLTRKSAGPVVNSIMKGAAVIGLAVASGGAAVGLMVAKPVLKTAGGAAGAVAGAPVGGLWGGIRETAKGVWNGESAWQGVKNIGKGVVGGTVSGAKAGAKAGFEPSKVGYGAKDLATKAGEAVGLVTVGTTSRAQKERLRERYGADEETKKTMEEADVRQIDSVASGRAYTDAQVREKVNAIVLAFKNGMADNWDDKKKRELAQYAIDSGVSSSEITKGQPDLIDLNKGAIEKQKAKIEGTVTVGTTKDENDKVISTRAEKDAYVERQAIRAAKREESARMKIENLENVSDEDVVREAKEKTAKGAQYLQEAVKRKILGEVGTLDQVGDLLTHSKENYGSSALKNARKLRAAYVKFDKEAIEKRAKEIAGTGVAVTPAHRKSARIALRDEIYKGLDPKEIKDMQEQAFNEKFVDNTTNKKIQKAGELGLSAKKIAALKALLPNLRAKRSGLPVKSDERKKLNAKIKAIKAL